MLSYSMILIFGRLQETTTYLTSGERLATPRWSSFCNSCAGVWIGRSASFERSISRDCDIDISAGFRLVQGAESWTICSELTKHTFHCFEPLCENTPQARQQVASSKKSNHLVPLSLIIIITFPYDLTIHIETGHRRVVRSNGRSIDETLTIMEEVDEGLKVGNPVGTNAHPIVRTPC
jgi:hypothetical protein